MMLLAKKIKGPKFRNPSRALEVIAASCSRWRFLAAPGGPWRLLALPGASWRLLAAPGGSWQLPGPKPPAD